MIINGDGGYGLLAAYRRACDLSRLAWSKDRRRFCIHRANRVNSRNGCAATMTAL